MSPVFFAQKLKYLLRRCYEILRIFPKDESTGEIKIVDGVGMCPGGKLSSVDGNGRISILTALAENLHGCIHYEEFLNDYDNDLPTEK